MRFVAVALGVLLFGTTAHAQAFKPRGGAKAAPAKTDKKPGKTKASAAKAAAAESDDEDSDEKPAKKKSSAKASATKSRGSKKGSRAAREGRPDDLTPGPAGKHDPDFVLITDDDDIE